MDLGRHHPLLKEVRRLRRSAAARRERGLLLAEGIHLAREALEAGVSVREAFIDERLDAHPEGADLARRIRELGVPVGRVSASVMDGLQDARSPQPVLMLVETAGLEERPWRGRGPVVVLDGVQDPGNLGAILRSADAAGAAGLIAAGDGVDPYHPRVVRASMGSVFRLPLRRRGLDEALDDLGREGRRIAAAVPRGGEPYDRLALDEFGALVFGGEGAGLPRAVAERLDAALTVPLEPGVESLSVAAAAAVVLFEAARRRRLSESGAPADG